MTEGLDQLRELARTFFSKELTPNQDRWAEQKQVDDLASMDRSSGTEDLRRHQ